MQVGDSNSIWEFYSLVISNFLVSPYCSLAIVLSRSLSRKVLMCVTCDIMFVKVGEEIQVLLKSNHRCMIEYIISLLRDYDNRR